ncbi:hypothetical protein LAV72_19620 [Lysinibacillus xylanilyticus]|uniref:hypothetical protein n=1 Tax=Lysinibacillus xylanilyticus TaxID=582475 RepID=UPI002B24C9E6|nr:hypothetical protein [Lysinibacillus xylanilyticus]MEB2301818.1 hypothetical protein [Lysinibacillus xylanilyticus]
MLLDCDEQLFMTYKKSGEKGAEKLLSKWLEAESDSPADPKILGTALSPKLFLVNEEAAMNIAFSTARKYWGRVTIEMQTFFTKYGLDTEFVNERLNAFFYTQKGKETFFDQLFAQHTMDLERLIWLIFGKRMQITMPVNELQTIFLYKFENEYLVHMIYKEDAQFWHWLFMKKVYSLFIHKPLEQFTFIHEMMGHIEQSTRKVCGYVDNFVNNYRETMDKCITHVDNYNATCLAKKQLHLYQIVTHYRLSEGEYSCVKALITSFEADWRYSMYALTEKEKVLIAYLLFHIAHKEKDPETVIHYGEYLLEDERLNNYAIEILLEYKELLPNRKPTPPAIIKNYELNFLENLYAVLLDQYVKMERYQEGLQLLKEHVLASNKKIHAALVQNNYSNEQFIAIEASVQQDIALHVNNSLQHIGLSVEEWRQHYRQPEIPYSLVAQSASLHMLNILKVLFVTEQYELFEKLMEIYKKYLLIDDHFEKLRVFMSAYV